MEEFSETIEAMREIVRGSGELFFSRIVSYELGEVVEDDHGGNRNFQSYLLAECILFATRIGIEQATIDRWRAKLTEDDSVEVADNLAPKPETEEE